MRDQARKAIGHFQRLTSRADLTALTDRELLDAFLNREEERAFEVLVRRHGPAVLGLCRRMLDNGPDADDAFQATFVVLALKAGSIRNRDAVGGWLHGVACRVARRARANALRRRALHAPLAAEVAGPPSEPGADDLRPVLDEELEQLPHKYRAPLILCYLEGKTNEQAARALGWPAGSMSRRLARARELLRGRLVRRGVTLSLGALSALLGVDGLSAAVPAGLSAGTVRVALLASAGGSTVAAGAVTGLVKGVMQTMLMTKLKIASLFVAAVGLLGIGAGLMLHRALASGPAPPAPTAGASVQGQEQPEKAQPPAKGKRPAPQQAEVLAVGFSPDARWVVSGSTSAILLTDAATGKVVRTLGDGQRGAVSVQVSPDGRMVASADGPNGDVRLWDAATGRELRRLQGHRGGATAVAFSPDGRRLASAEGTAVLQWDLATGKELTRLVHEADKVAALAYSPDGRTLATGGGADGSVYLWDVATAKLRWRSKAHKGRVQALAFAPDAQAVASGGVDGDVRLHDAMVGRTLAALIGHKGGVAALAYAPDGKRLFAAGGDELRVWDVAQGASALIGGQHRGLRALACSPDGRLLAYGGAEGLRLWDLRRDAAVQPQQ